MELSKEIIESLNNSKEFALQLDNDNSLRLLKEDFSLAVGKTIDKATTYVIKAMPVPDAIKDILVDVKESLKTRNLKTVITTAVKSSLREGLEILGVSSSNITSLSDLKNISLKGGFITALKNGIEIVANNYLKNNIVGEYVYKFFDKIKEYIMSRPFMQKLNKIVDNMVSKKDAFMESCNKWYEAYDKMDLAKINSISEKLSENKYILKRYEDCKKENTIIQNITAMVNNKKMPLTKEQTKLCEVT